MKMTFKLAKLTLLLVVFASLAGCDDVRVYGSVGYSGYSGYGGSPYYGGGGYRTSVGIGGRIY
ncbi:MAG: hypothetical protein IIC61_03020 [Proteobacteria bacterium]|nr:hypothetical protein [Pseudomonadota bacterium]